MNENFSQIFKDELEKKRKLPNENTSNIKKFLCYDTEMR